MLTIRVFPGQPLETNCYLVADREAGEGIVVDAPWKVEEEIAGLARELGVAIRLIVCTHGHWDHAMGLADLIAAVGAPAACHAGDAGLLERPTFAPFSFPFALTPVTPNRLLRDGEEIAVGAHRFTVLHTPGHTPGGLCLYAAVDHVLFSGDTLFAGACGRLDLPGGDPEAMMRSLQRLRALPPATVVYPGHGPHTTLAREGWLAGVEEKDLG
jgi:glyoxylase-like metal-dependent hydrolase (beta-lactamase superfamily II)